MRNWSLRQSRNFARFPIVGNITSIGRRVAKVRTACRKMDQFAFLPMREYLDFLVFRKIPAFLQVDGFFSAIKPYVKWPFIDLIQIVELHGFFFLFQMKTLPIRICLWWFTCTASLSNGVRAIFGTQESWQLSERSLSLLSTIDWEFSVRKKMQ